MRLKKLMIMAVVCVGILGNSMTIFAAEEPGNVVYEVDSEPICEMDWMPYSKKVTASDVWYGPELYAEGRLLCIESFVTVMDGTAEAYHYTRASIEHKVYGSVLKDQTVWGYGEVHSNIYGIPQSADPNGSYKGRVYYGW